MRNKGVQLYASEDVLTDFYDALANNDARAIQRFTFLSRMCFTLGKQYIIVLVSGTH